MNMECRVLSHRGNKGKFANAGDFGVRPGNEHVNVLLARSYVLGKCQMNNRSIMRSHPGLIPISLPSIICLTSLSKHLPALSCRSTHPWLKVIVRKVNKLYFHVHDFVKSNINLFHTKCMYKKGNSLMHQSI